MTYCNHKLRNRFIAETNAFLDKELAADRQTVSVGQGRAEVGTLVTVPRNEDGEVDQMLLAVLRRRLQNVLVGRRGNVMVDLDGVRLRTRDLNLLVSEFEERFTAAGRQLFVLEA